MGLCALDPTTPHGGLSAQFRCQFIFAFYNTSRTGTLSFSEFRYTIGNVCVFFKLGSCVCVCVCVCVLYREMMRDICTAKKAEMTDQEFDQATHDNWW